MPRLSFRNVGFEYIIICKADRGASFVLDGTSTEISLSKSSQEWISDTTSVVPCWSSGLAKNENIMPMFVLFSQPFLAISKVWLFSKMGGQSLTVQSSQTGCF